MGLIHHVGMVERNAGYAAGKKLAALGTLDKAFCINHALGIEGLDNRCVGFEEAIEELGIQNVAEIEVPEDNLVGYMSAVEAAVQGETEDWDRIGLLLLATGIPAAMPAAIAASTQTIFSTKHLTVVISYLVLINSHTLH